MNFRMTLGITNQSVAENVVEEIEALIQDTIPGYFVDTDTPPAATSRIRMTGNLKFPAGADLTSVRPFSAVSTSMELLVDNDGSATLTVEDGTGAKMLLNAEVVPVGTIVLDQAQDYDILVDQIAEEAVVTIGGVTTTTAFIASSNGSFQTNRAVGFLGRSTGANTVPENTEIKNLEVYFNDILYKTIPNTAAEANADPWHQGGNFTN